MINNTCVKCLAQRGWLQVPQDIAMAIPQVHKQSINGKEISDTQRMTRAVVLLGSRTTDFHQESLHTCADDSKHILFRVLRERSPCQLVVFLICHVLFLFLGPFGVIQLPEHAVYIRLGSCHKRHVLQHTLMSRSPVWSSPQLRSCRRDDELNGIICGYGWLWCTR